MTPLHYAALHNQCEVARILIAAGADLDAKDNVTKGIAKVQGAGAAFDKKKKELQDDIDSQIGKVTGAAD